MKRTAGKIIVLGLMALILQSSGLSLLLHRMTDKVHHCAGQCHAADKEAENSSPTSPQDDTSCPVCFMMIYVFGKYLDLSDTPNLAVVHSLIYPTFYPQDAVMTAHPGRPFSARGPPLLPLF